MTLDYNTPCPQVSLHMMVVYFWLIALVIGSMFMWSIAALDFHFNFRVSRTRHEGLV